MSCEKLKIRLIVVSTFWVGKINSQKFSNIEILEESISNKILVVLGIWILSNKDDTKIFQNYLTRDSLFKQPTD